MSSDGGGVSFWALGWGWSQNLQASPQAWGQLLGLREGGVLDDRLEHAQREVTLQ